MSTYDSNYGFTKPLAGIHIFITEKTITAYHTLDAKRRLTRILRLKSFVVKVIAAGELVEIYIIQTKRKRDR